MSHIRVALNAAAMRMPLRQAFDFAAEKGFDAVALDAVGDLAPGRLTRTAVLDLRKLLSDRRLGVSAVRLRMQQGFDSTIDLDRRVEAMKSMMQAAHDLGASVVVTAIGRIPADDQAPNWPMMLDILGELGAHGQRVGAMPTAETGYESLEEWRRLLEALPEFSLLLNLNPGHLLASGHSATEFAEKLGQHVGHVDATDGVRDAMRRGGDLTPFGEGAADFGAIVGVLAEHGYRGYYTVEPSAGVDAATECSRALRTLRGM